MNIGALNSRIVIQKNEVIKDKIGNHTNEWMDYFKCYATISNYSGSEEEKAGVVSETEKLFFTVRYSSETKIVTATEYRIIFEHSIYNINHVNLMGNKKNCVKYTGILVKR